MRLILALAASLLLAGCGRAASQPEANMAPTPQRSADALSLARVTPRSPGTPLALTSDAVGADGAIDLRHSGYGDNLSPPLRWKPVDGAGSYAIVLEDPDAPMGRPFVHWLIWNIPLGATALPEGLPATERLAAPQGALQGRNDMGQVGYFGPRPPPGTGAHHYHFEVFALDGPLTLKGGADLGALVEAMQGHVLADGELVGTYAAPARQ